MQGDDPPYLSVGTAVSAKYKGAFCEAKVSKVVRIVKCKVTYKMGLGTATVSDEHIKGTLRVGQSVQVKHPDKKDFVEATIAKIQDCSQYTVVFDDGDITTLRRTALCLKSGRHFNESETLDQLPLTHPEHFGNPVMGGRGARGRRSRQLKEDSSEGEAEEENEPDLEMYSADIGRVVSVESSEKKRNKDNWFPGLIVMPSAQPTVKINVKDEFLVRSFKDGRYYTVPKKEVLEFTRDMGARVESNVLAEAVEKAVKYLDEDELPIHWEKNSLFNTQNQYSDSEENFTDSSDDEPREEKDHFVAQLYKFMDDSGTPLNKSPMIGSRDVDLYRLFRIVHKLGGYNRVTNQSKWRTVTLRLKFSNNQNTFNQVKIVYKKCLFSYESFYRTLGCTMSDHTRSAKKNRGRSLIRDRDRVTPVQSPRPEKDEPVIEQPEKKEEEEKLKPKKTEIKKTEDEKKRTSENSDVSPGVNTDQIEPVASTSKDMSGRPKRFDAIKGNKDKKVKVQSLEKPKVVEKPEEPKKEEKEREDEKVQQTRSKGLPVKPKETIPSPDRKTREQKTPMRDVVMKVVSNKATKKVIEEEKKRGRKRINTEDKSNSDSAPEPTTATIPVNVGDKLKVYYGPTHESKAVTYEAKVIEIDSEGQGPIYMVHYTGWNNRYDEWITPQRIAENLSATTKAKRLKQGSAATKAATSTATTPVTASTSTSTNNINSTKGPSKRGRGISITGKSTSAEPPRSTTPSSITSSSGRTKSPATPVTTRNSRITRQGESNRRARRISVQTDVSLQSDSESGELESESEQSRTRSGNKSEDSETKPMRKKLTKTKGEKRKDDDDTEKEEEIEKPKKTLRKLKKSLEPKPTDESDDDNINLPKGRDFDLNQIRSELKGITKLKLHSAESSEKDTISSDDSTAAADIIKPLSEESDDKKEKLVESTSSSEDIYEFKEPEPFEFESHKIADDKNKKRFVPRILDSIEKSPKKKSPKSLTKKDTKDDDKKKFKGVGCTNKEDDDDIEDEKDAKGEDIEDPFDKLVESPSFHIGKSTAEKSDDYKKVTKILNLDSPLGLFKELPLIEDDTDERLDISDNEDSPNEPLFTHKETLFTNTPFSKSSPNSNIDSDCVGFTTPKSDDRKPTTSDDEDLLETTMKNVLSFDNDSNDALLLNQTSITYESPKQDDLLSKTITLNTLESEDESKASETFFESKDTQEKIASLSRQIAPVFQESDSSLLKDLYVTQFSCKSGNLKDISVKTGTKIADSILQKFNMIKSQDSISPNKSEHIDDKDDETVQTSQELDTELKIDTDEEKELKDMLEKTDDVKSPEMKRKTPSPKETLPEPKIKSTEKIKDSDLKKRPSRKFVSKEFIEDTDTDSSDSDERLIMDEDSQTSMSLDMKQDIKESDSNASFTKNESIEIEEPQRNFKFDNLPHNKDISTKEDNKMEAENNKEDEPDSHSLLWCEETIPGSPAPPSTEHEIKPKKNELEMPFASVPCSSSSSTKNLLSEIKSNNKERIIPPPLAINMDSQDTRNASSAVLDNTPPTTPESTLSNLSPRGENGDLSPNTADNESCKSTEAENDYPNLRRGSSNKVSPYSEEDTLMNSESGSASKKSRDDILPSPCKKRRRSCKTLDDIPAKRGRKPNNRSRHNSDSDDTSEHSTQGSTNITLINNIDTRLSRSPRPSKYNFFVEFDPSLDSTQRIAVLQQKLTELRKTYANVKAELATIERRRKKIRRREREAKASKQELACT